MTALDLVYMAVKSCEHADGRAACMDCIEVVVSDLAKRVDQAQRREDMIHEIIRGTRECAE